MKKSHTKKGGRPEPKCSIHKTQSECNDNNCLWGKTGKCSKKRERKKEPVVDVVQKTNLSCKAHKTQSECIDNNCLWGKTGKCRKKREKSKEPVAQNLKMSDINNHANVSELETIQQYPNSEILTSVCKSFEGQEISLTVTFMGKIIPICNCNAVGDILEDVFYPIIKENLDDFEKGPKQASPDYYGINKHFEFEQKVFMKNPNFDIGNFTSYVNMLCQDGGVYKKLFKTKYLVFEYAIINKKIKIIKFHYLNVYNLVGYSGKTPITMQIKKNMWYNIRPESVK